MTFPEQGRVAKRTSGLIFVEHAVDPGASRAQQTLSFGRPRWSQEPAGSFYEGGTPQDSALNPSGAGVLLEIGRNLTKS